MRESHDAGYAGLTLAFEPCMDGNGYPVLEEVSLARRRYSTTAFCKIASRSFHVSPLFHTLTFLWTTGSPDTCHEA